MSDLREAYSATALASLEWSEEVERAVDRVAAAGKASTLGVAIWKARYLNESSSYDKATKELTQWFMGWYKGEQKWLAEKIAEQCLYEFIFHFCQACGGVGEAVVEDLRVSCGTCHGSRVKRYSDSERCSRMKISWAMTKALRSKMQRTIGKVFDEDMAVNLVLNAELRDAQ